MSAVVDVATPANPANSGTLPPEEIPNAAFDDMGLRVGDRMQLALQAGSRGEHCMVRLIGYVRDQTVLVSAPPPGCWQGSISEGDSIVVRVFSGRSAFGFVCQVEKIIRLPFEYVHLSFPRTIAGRVIRRSRRVKTGIAATIEGGAVQSGTISNLSSTGAEVCTEAAPGEAGATVGLSFTIGVHGVETPIALKAAIRSIRETAGEGKSAWRSGVEFLDVPVEALAALKNLIYQELIERPQSLT